MCIRDSLRIVRHCLVQWFFLRIGHALLRPIDVGSAVFAAERVCYIAGHLEIAFGKSWICSGTADGGNFGERLRAFSHIISLTVEKYESKRL